MSALISAQEFVQQRAWHPACPDLSLWEFAKQREQVIEREVARTVRLLHDNNDPRLRGVAFGTIEERCDSVLALIESLYGTSNRYRGNSIFNDEAIRRWHTFVQLHREFPDMPQTYAGARRLWYDYLDAQPRSWPAFLLDEPATPDYYIAIKSGGSRSCRTDTRVPIQRRGC